MSDVGVAGVDEWDGGPGSPLADVADMTLGDVRRQDLPALAAAVTMVLADLDNPARYGQRESSLTGDPTAWPNAFPGRNRQRFDSG